MAETVSGTAERLEAPHVIEYDYTRSTGPVIGAFLTGLRDGRIYGVRAADGRVLVPPQEYDPQTSESIDEMVEVGDEGEVVTWTRRGSEAWALVRLDGADTPLLHRLEADAPETGQRVRVRWADHREGTIQDIACFVPAEGTP